MCPRPPPLPPITGEHHNDCLLSSLHGQRPPASVDSRCGSNSSASMSISTLSSETWPFISAPTRPMPLEPTLLPPPGPGVPGIEQNIPISPMWKSNIAPRFRPDSVNSDGDDGSGRLLSAFSFATQSREREELNEPAPLSPRSFEPQTLLLPSELVTEHFDSLANIPVSDLNELPCSPDTLSESSFEDDGSFTPTQCTLQYHSGGNYFLPYPTVPTKKEEMLYPPTPRANALPPELLSPFPEQVERVQGWTWKKRA